MNTLDYQEVMSEFSKNIVEIDSFLSILKVYTEEKSIDSQDMANIDKLLEIVIERVEAMWKLL